MRRKSSKRSSARHQTWMVARWVVQLLLAAAASAGPSLESFNIDLNLGFLELNFDSAVSNATGSIDWTGVSLRTHSSALEGQGVSLWNTQGKPDWGGASSSNFGLTLRVNLHPVDQDELKAAYVGHNSSFTWIELRPGTFKGSQESGDPSEPVYGEQMYGYRGMSVKTLIPDITSPVLEKFILDLARRELVIFFSEAINISTVRPSELSIFTTETAQRLQLLQHEPTVRNASASCSSARRGRAGSWREIVLKLDEACAGALFSVSSNLSLNSSSREMLTDASWAEGYRSDWEKLGSLGVFEDNGAGHGAPAKERRGDKRRLVMINATSTFISDFAYPANALLPVNMLEESFPGESMVNGVRWGKVRFQLKKSLRRAILKSVFCILDQPFIGGDMLANCILLNDAIHSANLACNVEETDHHQAKLWGETHRVEPKTIIMKYNSYISPRRFRQLRDVFATDYPFSRVLGSTDCQPCGNGTFRSEPCTDIYDAVCTACTEACSGGELFTLSPCTAETDLSCHQCTQCPFGTREVAPCDATSDRACEACTECAEGEYESRACNTGGDDRICESCLRCSMSAAVAKACRDSPPVLVWQMEHCCKTVEGESVPCSDVALENLRISAREGRRHWVFEPSIPPVHGYAQDYWGKGPAARDGVPPYDGFIEVEFREGARSVFDDPRYWGQEGPTLGGPDG